MEPFAKLLEIKDKVPHSIPDYLINFVKKFGDYSKGIYIHSPHNISNQKDTDIENIVRRKGLFGGSEIKNNNEFNHHFRIFYNNEGKARVVYKHIGRISFLKTNR